MNSIVKKIILSPLYWLDWFSALYLHLLSFASHDFKYRWRDEKYRRRDADKIIVHHQGLAGSLELSIFTPNVICRTRALSFSSKEPETLDWIDRFGASGVFFDIGANIGLYSMYYAKKMKCPVYAFEPSFLNLRLLARNIHENDLNELVKIIASPLADVNMFSNFTLSSTEEGGALSAFAVDYTYNGLPIHSSLKYSTLGFSLDYMLDQGLIQDRPSLIKIDVDGIEHLILMGAIKTLSHPSCKSVLVEINENFLEQSERAHKVLTECGFMLESKGGVKGGYSSRFSTTCNQIWIKG